MEGFTIIDAVVAVVILISAILAYSRGFVREVMAILGWVAAAVVAVMFAPTVAPMMREVPYLGDFLAENCELSIIAAFAALFALALVVAALFTPLFTSLIRRSALGALDQGFGFLFGVARGVLLVAVAFLVYERAVATAAVPMVDDSRSAAIFAALTESLEAGIPDDAPGWIVARYEELVSSCAPADQ